MRIVDRLAVPTFILAGGLVYLAEQLNLPILTPIAIGVLGVFAMLLGAGTMIEGRFQLFDRLWSRREQYSGLPARLLGLAIFFFGLLIVSFAGWEALSPGAAGRFLSELAATERGLGLLLIVFGFFMALFGIARLVAGSAHPVEQRRPLTDLGFRLGGLVTLAAGIALVLAGLWIAFMGLPG